jgi:predicted sugar kinase
MNQQILEITSEPIGAGQERICYRHPEDAAKVVKIQKGESDKQTRRELELYENLSRRLNFMKIYPVARWITLSIFPAIME